MAFYQDQVALDPKRRLFNLIAKPGQSHLVQEDFKPLFKHLLATHPGLEFLQATPEF
jgi:serine/threonine-protein phosphatase 2A regulatory subunit B''